MATRSGDDRAPEALQPSEAAAEREKPVKTGESAPGTAAEGTEGLMDKLVEENLPWLRGWLRGRLSDPELVHDVCQESFLKALKSVSRLKDVSRFPAWLYRIAENTLRDHLRRKARWRHLLKFTDELKERGVEPSSAEDLDTSEEAEKLLQAIRGLPARYREPLLLRHARDLSYAEIGAILGISENAVQVRVFRARQMLKSKVAGALKDVAP